YLNGELPDSDEVAEMYAFGVDKLRGLGFERYEVSNFCKRGKESKHNLNYWRRGEYIGLGVSASSHIKNVRFTNTFNLDEYFKCIMTNRFPVVDKQEIDVCGQKDETVMLALRTEKGMSLTDFDKTFAACFLKEYSQPVAKNRKYLDITHSRIRIKPEYLYVQNSIICDFLLYE
ncbi:MAG: hypothetical protein K2O67_03785, partial [Clostridia bacterium]|nr:hypothetical protein [Clostridia bacterium]